MIVHHAMSNVPVRPPRTPTDGFVQLLEAGLHSRRLPLPGEAPSQWAIMQLLVPALEGAQNLDATCVLHQSPDGQRPLSVSFVRDTQRMQMYHLHHLPALYQQVPGALGSLLAHLEIASSSVCPVFTPALALATLFPWFDTSCAGGRKAALYELALEADMPGVEEASVEAQRRFLRGQGQLNPLDVHGELEAYLVDQPLPLSELQVMARHCPHLEQCLGALQALVRQAETLPVPAQEDWLAIQSGQFQEATVQGCASATFAGPDQTGAQRVPCLVEHALNEWGQQGMHTDFSPHWTVQLSQPGGAQRLLDYLKQAPQIQTGSRRVLRALSLGRTP